MVAAGLEQTFWDKEVRDCRTKKDERGSVDEWRFFQLGH